MGSEDKGHRSLRSRVDTGTGRLQSQTKTKSPFSHCFPAVILTGNCHTFTEKTERVLKKMNSQIQKKKHDEKINVLKHAAPAATYLSWSGLEARPVVPNLYWLVTPF